MNRKAPHAHTPYRLHRAALAAGILLACVSMAGNVSAQAAGGGVVTTDPGALAKLIDQFEKQVQQYAEQVKQYELQLQQYQQMLITIQNLGSNITIHNTPQHLDQNQLAQMECGNGGAGASGLLGSLFGSLLAPESPFVQKQQEICQQIVAIKVAKYNDTSDMMKRMNYYANLVNKTEESRNSVGSSNNGDLSANSNQVLRNSSELNAEMANWQTQMQSYDTMLKALEGVQSDLAKASLNGNPNLLNASAQAAVLEAALKVNQ